jgi:hypothetical protein
VAPLLYKSAVPCPISMILSLHPIAFTMV